MSQNIKTDKEIQVNGNTVEINAEQNLRTIADETGHEDAIGARVNGDLRDLRDVPQDGAEIEFVTYEDEDGKSIYWHTSAHVLAQAVGFYVDGDVKLGVGPPIEEGFYYDFDLPRTLSEDELDNLEGIINQIIQRDLSLERFSTETEKAIERLEEQNQEYKIELVEELEDKPSFYRQEGFEDLCAGPHLMSTGEIGAVKLTKLSGAYWKGDQDNPEMQRIYGISFRTEEEMEDYEQRLEEAKKRDHRRLGEKLDLFHIENDIGPGLVVWHPNGGRIRSTIEDFWKQQHFDQGYEIVNTPHIARETLWDISGHLDHYEEDMFPGLEMDDEAYRLKPMTCPFHMKIFNSDTRSYRELPLRLAEMGTVYRNEMSGVLHGLLRVRGFTQDDAHIFCTPDQVEDEIIRVMDFITSMLSTFGFDEYEIFVSTQPDDFVGNQERWDLATDALKDALDSVGLEFEIDPGEGVFYGPKIDLKIRDTLDREWQCSTIQVDFNLPKRFDIEYIDDEGEPRRPIMIHRALFGSVERFFGCLTEHYGGAFPPWLAPTPVWILPISDENTAFAQQVKGQLEDRDIRVHLENARETLGKRIQRSQSQKIPYTIILGSDEEQSQTVELRQYGADSSKSMDVGEAIEFIQTAIKEKKFIHKQVEEEQ